MDKKDNSNPILLTETDWQRIAEYSETINILDTKVSLEYALPLQKKCAALPNAIMSQLKKDLAPQAYDVIQNLLTEIEAFTPTKEILEHPMRNRKEFKKLRSEYNKISEKLSKLLAILQEQELVLMQNASTLSKLQTKVKKEYRALYMHIEAGKRRLMTVQKALELAPQNTSGFNEQYAHHETIRIAIRSFQERLASLEVTEKMLITLLAQLSTYIETNKISLNKVSHTYRVTIPAWRKQLSIALRTGDVVDAIYSSKGEETVDYEAANKSLCESISDLKNSFVSNQTSKTALDQVYLLSKDLQKELSQKSS